MNRFQMLLPFAVAACAPASEAPTYEEAGESGPYRYVLGYVVEDGVTIAGGAHDVVSFKDRGQDAIDSPNEPGRLHPALQGAEYGVWQAGLTEGQAEWNVFPSSWWPQSKNGIAQRWNGGSQDYGEVGATDDLSPAEKYDLLFNPGAQQKVAKIEHWSYAETLRPETERGAKHAHEAVTAAGPATAWELQNHGEWQGHVHPDSWWGHCNGWASYVTAEPGGAPARDVRVKHDGGRVVECAEGETAGCVLVRMGDIEALMTEVYFSDQATFAGRRCNTDPSKMERDELGRPKDSSCRDTNPGSFHVAITGLLHRGAESFVTKAPGKLPFVIDHNYDWEVWNFPLVRYRIDQEAEVSEEEAQRLVGAAGSDYQFNADAVRFVRVEARYWMISDGVSSSEMLVPAAQRSTAPHETELHYVLELAQDGEILGGEWIVEPEVAVGDGSKRAHPDFMWMAVQHRGYGEDADDLGGDDDNPFIAYSKVKALLDCANDAATCAPAAAPPGGDDVPPPAGPCANACGAEGTGGCWCDSSCAEYGDCCTDACTSCGSGC